MIRTHIAGTNFRPIAAQVRAKALIEGEELFLEAEPENQFDPNAIRVFTQDGVHIGYIPKTKNEDLLTWMHEAHVYWSDGKLEILNEAEYSEDEEEDQEELDFEDEDESE